uniref:Myomesin 1 n=1 Tax=Denticeps clupeoides TaxID=299321 RepID=A0AAY4AEX1_9TELE
VEPEGFGSCTVTASGTKEEEHRLRSLPKKAKRSYLAVDKDTEVIGYVVPVFRSSHQVARELMESQEEVKEEGVGYVVMRNLFSREEDFQMKVEKKTRKKLMRESADRLTLGKKMHEKEEFQKKMNPDSLTHPAEFMVKPKGQTVWEGKNVTLHCTVAGWPKPRVAWYKNNVPIDAKGHPDKYTVESNYNMHSLEIKSCDFMDTAEYRASALNVKGESSSFASVVVKRFQEDEVVSAKPHGFCDEYGVTFIATIIDKFGVSFGHEGETMSLGCTVIIYPNVKRYQPDVLWYRDNVLLKPSKWVNMHWSGEKAMLTLVHLNKEDEGLYTLRVNTKSGFETHSAYVFVRDADVEEEGVPVAPLDVRCHDANKDYVVVTWKQPAVEGSSSILGYFIDRCEVGTKNWVQCNDTPVTFARFPVTGLVEGRSYYFRVRAINRAGESRPSRVSDPVAAVDPSDRARLRARPSAPWTGMIKFSEEDPTVGVVPGQPSDLAVTEATKSYVVLSWKPPEQRGHEGIMYFVEKCIVGTDTWQRVNTGMPSKSPRFALFDLAEGNSYSFRVRCCNSAGVGEPSEPTRPTTVGDKLDLPSTPGPVVATRNTATSVVVSWGASKEVKRLVGYYIEVGVEGSNVWVPCNNKPVKCTRFVCHGLTTGEKCVFRVKAVNAAGYSDSSAASEAVLVQAGIAIPAPPTGVTLAERFQGYMVLSWQAPTKTGGADIRGYYLDYRTVKDGVADGWHELNTQAVTGTSYKAVDLKENKFYQFQVRAANMAGLSVASPPSAPLECKEWTVAVPGPAHGLHVLEVRKHSLVLLWETPAFNGRSAVTGYYVDIKEASASDGCWKGVNERSTQKHYLKVAGLKEGVSYVLRVSAKNIAGVGIPCEPLGPIVAETRPGTNEIVVDVDDDGVISMIFECSEMREGSQFVWSRDYEALTDTSRLNIQTAGGRSRAIFTDLSAEDLGSYSCMVTNTDGFSSSYTLTEEDLKRLLDLSFEHKFPVIPFKSEMAIELQEKGRVRFWAQVAKFTSGCQVEYVFNENVVTQGEKYTMHFDKSTGIIEMFMDLLEVTDEGTFTFNLVDGKATGRTSLVLIGEEFAALQKKSEFERAEWVRRQGPHFVEYLGFEVTAECNVHLKCKIGNIKPETEITWFKDAIEIEEEDEAAKHITAVNGVLTFDIGKTKRKKRKRNPALTETPEDPKSGISKADTGVYEVKLKDERGKDKSLFDLTGKGYEDIMNEVFRVIANSATELSVQSTEHGIILHTSVVYYTEELRVGWLLKDAKISHSDRVQCGVSGEQLWLKINEPTEKDKGKYGINIFDGKDGVKRVFDLTGQAWEEAYEEFKRLNPSEHFYSLPHTDRARVVGGLPDVVTIQEGKSLNLTGNVWGDPAPEVSWLKNDRELKSDEHYTLKFEHGKYASITIAAVTTVDSGKYALQVKNKYGTEAMPFTVSVYFPEDEEVKGDKKE